MSQSTKILLGVLTFLPFLMLLGLLAMVFSFAFGVFHETAISGDPDPEMVVSNVFPIILIGSAAGFLSMAIVIYYIIHVVSNKNIDNTIQVIWVIILLLTSPLGSMVYWYMNIWKDPPVSKSPPLVNTGYTN